MRRDIEYQRAMMEYCEADIRLTRAVYRQHRVVSFRLWFMRFMGMNIPKR